MPRSIPTCCAVLVLLAAPLALAQEAGIASLAPLDGGGEVMSKLGVSPSPARIALVDATLGRTLFPLPASRRAFASHADFAAFLQQSLNATPVYDAAGKVVGARGWLLQLGKTYYVDPTYAVRQITDPVGGFIGGQEGVFTVAGVTYTTGLQGELGAGAPKQVLHCSPAGECIAGHSWNTHWAFSLHDSVGTDVEQVFGGYQEDTHFCWKWGFVPWACTTSSGTNQLSLQGALFYDSYEVLGYGPRTPMLAWTTNMTRSNVTRIAMEEWSYFFGSGPSPILIGACGRDSSPTVNSVGATYAGSTIPASCFGAGVTCLSGTLCERPTPLGTWSECTDLSSDPGSCGACWNACPSGWTCQARTCVAPPPEPLPPPTTGCPIGYRNCGGDCVKKPAVCP